jgi:hypothetical protein
MATMKVHRSLQWLLKIKKRLAWHFRLGQRRFIYLLFACFWPRMAVISLNNQPKKNTEFASLCILVHLLGNGNCLIVTLNTIDTDGVVFSFFKVPCIVAVIVGTPNQNRRPWSTRALGCDSVHIHIFCTRKITVTLSLSTTSTNVSGKSHVFLTYTLYCSYCTKGNVWDSVSFLRQCLIDWDIVS